MATTYTLISSVTVGSGGAASMTFSSIPATYTNLLVKISIKSNESSNYSLPVMIFNGDTGNNYSAKFIYGINGTTAGSSSVSSYSSIPLWYSAGTATANTFGNGEIYIPNYTSSNYKSSSVDSTGEANQTGSNLALTAGLWSSTASINSITISNSSFPFLQYSTAYLYGISSS